MESLRVTELSNKGTEELDLKDGIDLARLILQVLSEGTPGVGWGGLPSFYDQSILECVDLLINKIATLISTANSKNELDKIAVVISGAGTSGRLAFFAARQFNYLLEQH